MICQHIKKYDPNNLSLWQSATKPQEYNDILKYILLIIYTENISLL